MTSTSGRFLARMATAPEAEVSDRPRRTQVDPVRGVVSAFESRLFRGDDEAMNDTDVRERPDRAHRTGGTAFDLTVSKLLRPRVRPGTVRRSSLLDRLAAGDQRPIVSVVAPPGYGKTTLLSRWAESGGPPFAWVSVDEKDNDPKVLLTYVTAALDAIEPNPR
jgi:hypothetical protein